MEHKSTKFHELYDPHCEAAVDEAIIQFQGRSSLKQYMPNKPIKRGIKAWVLAESHNGYFPSFSCMLVKKGVQGPDLVVGWLQHWRGTW